jgi:hypothetical protein
LTALSGRVESAAHRGQKLAVQFHGRQRAQRARGFPIA